MRRLLTLVLIGTSILPAQAFAQDQSQDRASGWEVEVYGGGAFGTTPRGDTTPPPVGTPFTTFNGLPSRTVASWYFGDGTALFNEFAAAARGEAGGRASRPPPAKAVRAGSCCCPAARAIAAVR